MMKVKLFTKQDPSGRSLLLAKRLEAVSTSSPKEALAMAIDIFCGAHKETDPAIVSVRDGVDLSDLLEACRDFGIEAVVER